VIEVVASRSLPRDHAASEGGNAGRGPDANRRLRHVSGAGNVTHLLRSALRFRRGVIVDTVLLLLFGRYRPRRTSAMFARELRSHFFTLKRLVLILSMQIHESEMTGGTVDAAARLNIALADRYRIERELGRGGMATVFLGHDVRHDRAVAVKVLRSDLSESLGRDRFLQEIRLAARLSHPHILPLFDSGDASGFLFFVMPVMEGETLRDRLIREPRLSVDTAIRIASQIGDALDYAHGHGVVHRDIKPENILLHAGHALVADFGIGKAVTAAAPTDETLTQIGVAVGTPAYMSPEQAAGDEVDGRSDLFSLGCVFYEMLAGEQPFTGPTLQAVIAQRFHHVPPAPSVRRPEVSALVCDVIARLLEKAPESRMSSGAQMAAALQSRELVAPTARASGKSVAVLPFASMSANADDGFFADGMTEEIINVLGQLKGLRGGGGGWGV
jgi:eukaryotic-like serine/threonine-protein kinase